ncbi:3-oxoacyl-ACP synthase III family protein [Streptomyces virginiae]|uniref:3-oxoacyl-ACP synthase III family protein n=1 Tax=Streptomyces virginiae TaxID=1961 RepID=UPI00365AF0EA
MTNGPRATAHPTAVLATGSYLPEQIVHNDEVASTTGVTDEWIVRKTGIHERRRAAPHEATSDLAAHAGRRALEQAGIHPHDLAYIVVATSTPDQPQPATAAVVQHLLGAVNAAAFDVNSVCSGFVCGLTVTERLLGAEPGDAHGLVIGADIYSRILDHTDRRTAILFGDGAGAAVLGPSPSGHGMLGTSLLTRGDQHELIGVPAGGSRRPASARTLAEGAHHFRMDGRGVRAFVQENLPAAVADLLTRTGLPAGAVDHFVPHQANAVMIGEVWPALGLDNAALHLELARYGNTGAASIAVTLDEIHRRGLLAEDDVVLLSGFGGGMSVGSTLLSWAPTAHPGPPPPPAPPPPRGPPPPPPPPPPRRGGARLRSRRRGGRHDRRQIASSSGGSDPRDLSRRRSLQPIVEADRSAAEDLRRFGVHRAGFADLSPRADTGAPCRIHRPASEDPAGGTDHRGAGLRRRTVHASHVALGIPPRIPDGPSIPVRRSGTRTAPPRPRPHGREHPHHGPDGRRAAVRPGHPLPGGDTTR